MASAYLLGEFSSGEGVSVAGAEINAHLHNKDKTNQKYEQTNKSRAKKLMRGATEG